MTETCCWAVVEDVSRCLGIGISQADAVMDAKRKLEAGVDTDRQSRLSELTEVPMVMLGVYPPLGCVGLIPISRSTFDIIKRQGGIYYGDVPLFPYKILA